MDILNFISWIRGSRLVKTVEPTKTLIPLGVKTNRRDDEYLPVTMTVEDFATQLSTIVPPTVNVGLYSQTVSSTPITNTILESDLISTGVGSLSIPANSFKVGDSFNFKLIGHLFCNSSATIRFRIKAGTTILADTGVIAMSTSTNKHWEMDISFTVRTLGAAGVASIASGGIFSYTKNAGTNFEGIDFSIINNTTFDTTTNNTLKITAEWGAASTANSIYSEIFILNKTY